MKEKEIQLLREQIEKLDQKNFDLEAWKNYTIVLLARIFGNDSQKIKQIEKLDYEYNSWSLRDTTGYSSYLETCKKLGKEILEASITEIESFGIPTLSSHDGGKVQINVVLDALDDELKGSQFKALIKLLKSNINPEEKKRQLHELLAQLDPGTVNTILEGILLNKDFAESLPG